MSEAAARPTVPAQPSASPDRASTVPAQPSAVNGAVLKYERAAVPTIRAFMQSDAFIRGLMGPIGGGKSSGCVWDLIQRGVRQAPGPDGVRRTRFAIIRNSYRQLADTTIRTVHEWFPPHVFGEWRPSDHRYTIKALRAADDEPPAEIELLFRALDRPDQVGNLLSLELTGAWVNEAREVPWALIEMVQSRLDRYPAKRNGGASWTGLTLDTNPPDIDSDWYKFFEATDHSEAVAELAEKMPSILKTGYAALFKQPSGLGPDAENLKNLAAGYYERNAIGKSPDWIKVYLKGEYGFIIDGRPVFPEYSDRFHCEQPNETKDGRGLRTIPGVPIYRGWDFGLCYSEDTEVLTDSGWKLFRDVDPQKDKAASRDPATGRMEYAPIAFKIDREYDGEMLEWSNTEISLCVTPEHRVPFTYRDTPGIVRFQSAEWIAEHPGGHHYVDLLSKWEGSDAGTWFGMGAPEWAALLGVYLAEGCVDRGRVTIYQAHRDSDIEAILRATGLPWTWRGEGGKASGWRLWHPLLAAYLSKFGLARTKRVPPEVHAMTPGTIRGFLLAHTLGDGHIRQRANGAVEHTTYTTSRALAGDLQALAQKAGWNASVRMQRARDSVITEGATKRVIPGSDGWVVTYKKRASRAELLRRNFRRVQYKGRIYCLNVPWHTLYVRRNGKAHWNGNTPACVFTQLLPTGQWFIADELVADSLGIDRFSEQVISHSHQYFPGCAFVDYGDPAGMQRAQTDERTCFEILHAKGIAIEAAEQSVSIRLESVRKPLTGLVDGARPQFVIHPRCQVLRRGLVGGYQFRRLQVSGERYTEKPDKNRYSHVADALCYVASRLFGPTLRYQPGEREDADDAAFRSRMANDRSRSLVTGY